MQFVYCACFSFIDHIFQLFCQVMRPVKLYPKFSHENKTLYDLTSHYYRFFNCRFNIRSYNKVDDVVSLFQFDVY